MNFKEQKLKIDNILSNIENGLSEEDLNFIVSSEPNIKTYFFSKLSNHLVFEPLAEKELLEPPETIIQPKEDGTESILYSRWTAGEYLEKIVDKKPDGVFEIVKNFINKYLNKDSKINMFALEKSLELSKTFKKDLTQIKKRCIYIIQDIY